MDYSYLTDARKNINVYIHSKNARIDESIVENCNVFSYGYTQNTGVNMSSIAQSTGAITDLVSWDDTKKIAVYESVGH